MRHQKAGRRLGRNSAHRKAMFSNMVASLIKHGRIETTEAKAKELRRWAEPTINWAVRVAELELKGRKKLTDDEKARFVHAIRMAKRVCKDTEAIEKLFHEIGPGYLKRPGGYTRILKTRTRVGDAAPMAFVELMPGELPKPKKSTKKAAPKAEAKADEPKAEDKPKKKTPAKNKAAKRDEAE